MQVLYYVLLAVAAALFLCILILKDKKSVLLTANGKIILRRENGVLNLYQNKKKVCFAVLSFGSLFYWYVLGKQQVYVINRFKSRVNAYTYDNLPKTVRQKLTKVIDLPSFVEQINL